MCRPRPQPVVLEQIETIAGLRARLADGGAVGLVPTMGALHAGHVALIDAARRDCDVVVVSIFVNPLQFTNADDLARYPQTLDADLAVCGDRGVDIVFTPQAAEMYPQPPECTVDVGRMADHLCGKYRPGHFRGVATIVLKLFQIVQPRFAYFGQKDAQQLAIVTRLTTDFNLSIRIVDVPTVREPDGLALSSRNRHLNADERRMAVSLYRALTHAAGMIREGGRNTELIRRSAIDVVPQTAVLRLEYLEIVDARTMQPVTEVDRPVCIAGAMWVGTTRLIDNVLAVP
jgi:pantoate--beta-alanine ligase